MPIMPSKPPKWTFVIEEKSAGCYHCEAFANGVASISKSGFEDVITDLLREAFHTECQRGTPHGTAAFSITAGFLYLWYGEYRDEVFGSWLWQSLRQPKRIVYDGRDFHLAAYSTLGCEPIWQGHIRELSEPDCRYFHHLVYL